jgi:DNA polymerase V
MKFIPAVSEASIVKIPLFTERCPAGFPSPAADYTESELDLNEYCIHRRHSTYFVRAIGNSMTDIGLYSGDLMVVDKAEQPRHGDIVIAEIEGEFTVKRLLLTPRPALQAMNPDFPSLYPDPETLQIFGVVTAFIHKTRDTTDVRPGRRQLLLRQLREGFQAGFARKPVSFSVRTTMAALLPGVLKQTAGYKTKPFQQRGAVS